MFEPVLTLINSMKFKKASFSVIGNKEEIIALKY